MPPQDSILMTPQPIYLDEKDIEDQPLLSEQNPTNDDVAAPPRRRKSKWRRLIVGLVYVSLTYVLLVGTSTSFYQHLFRSASPPKFDPSLSLWGEFPPEITPGECAEWIEHDEHSSIANFELPVSSETLFFLSRGLAAGVIRVQHHDASSNLDSSDDDDVDKNHNVQVEVKAVYKFPESLDHVDVCLATRAEGENGLSIFGHRAYDHDHHRIFVRFEVTAVLPNAAKDKVLNIKNLETDLPFFFHDIGDLNGLVHFDSVSLKTSNVPIHVKSLGAKKAAVQTANSNIQGEIHSSSSLKIHTSNAPIHVDVTLFNDDKGGDFTDLDIYTANGNIKANLTLDSAHSTGGNFKITSHTSNAPIDIIFTHAPSESTLILNSITSLGPNTVSLHPTYEGYFTAATSLGRTKVEVDEDVEDPEGKGRKRVWRWSYRGNVASGSVQWVGSKDEKFKKGDLKGVVDVRTSLAPVTLKL
ncbi:hypothetical protein H0H93_011148 [Arthromyces matolae]|nr:hypothetical protein H0H93_011148 [Arthromyces matolae]